MNVASAHTEPKIEQIIGYSLQEYAEQAHVSQQYLEPVA
jgi:hypothetical protein